MRAKVKIAIVFLAILVAAVLVGNAAGAGRHKHRAPLPAPPAEFFGVTPQTPLTDRDAQYMKAGGISTVRIEVPWEVIQPTPRAEYHWGWVDPALELASRNGLKILPFVFGTPKWLSKRPTNLPIDTERARQAWGSFLAAAVARYGPRGEFWKEHSGTEYEPALPRMPIRTWQIWNEANFFYFATPASPQRYAKLVTISSKAIKTVDPGAKVILSGLFAKPNPKPPRGMPATQFLRAFYRTPGIKSRFDGIALHPYAINTESLEELVEEFHEVTVENHDRVPMYITEMGWGSQNDYHQVAFEQGVQGQVRELRNAYTYLLENQRRLDLKQAYWFSWKDNREIFNCNFCDSTGLFKEGRGFRPKPAWSAFVTISGGSARP